jgi:hypothetical protein
MQKWPLISLVILISGCGDAALRRSDRPIPSARALGVFDPVLPAAATNIYYVDFVGGLQDLELFVRFSVPPSEVDSAIEALIAHNNRQMGRSLAYARRPLTADGMVGTVFGRFRLLSWRANELRSPNLGKFSVGNYLRLPERLISSTGR